MKTFKKMLRIATLGLFFQVVQQPVLAEVPMGSTAQECAQKAEQLYRQGNPKEALEYAQAALAKNPQDWKTLQVAGYAAYQLGDGTKAWEDCRKSLQLNPGNTSLWTFLDRLVPSLDPAGTLPTPGTKTAPQGDPSPTFRFGLQTGFNASNIQYDPTTTGDHDLYPRVGWVAGGFFQVNFGPIFALEAEALFTQMGFTETFDLGSLGSHRFTYALDYLEFPLLAKVYVPGGPVKPNFFLGGSVGVLLDANIVDEGDGQKISIQDYLNDSQGSLIAGVGVDIERFSITLRYQRALDLFNPLGSPKAQNEGFLLMTGVSFI